MRSRLTGRAQALAAGHGGGQGGARSSELDLEFQVALEETTHVLYSLHSQAGLGRGLRLTDGESESESGGHSD